MLGVQTRGGVSSVGRNPFRSQARTSCRCSCKKRRHSETERGRERQGDGEGEGEGEGDDLFERVFAELDREAGLYLAHHSHEASPRVPGMGWFYGELSFDAARGLLERAKPRRGEVFVDLGSGLGKMVFAAASLGVLGRSYGIEILPELHERATQALDSLAVLQTSREDGETQNVLQHLSRCSLVCGDMFTFDLRSADLVFSFATCFASEVMTALELKLASEMKPGARLILVSKQLSVAKHLFEPWGPDEGYVPVEQAHNGNRLDCFLYVKR